MKPVAAAARRLPSGSLISKLLWLALLLTAALAAVPASAGSSQRTCSPQGKFSAEQHNHLLRFAALIKQELDASGAKAVLISRSGLDLSRFDIRYSHAGISLQEGNAGQVAPMLAEQSAAAGTLTQPNSTQPATTPWTPWMVRQLYFACDEGAPRLFDQGLTAFLMGTDSPDLGYISVVILPPEAESALAAAALNKPQALSVLHPSYSANAYSFGLTHQNCNQWVAELMALAWGAPDAGALQGAASPRAWAQSWLRQEGFSPSTIAWGWPWIRWAGYVVPWIHEDDHPEQDLAQGHYRVSMPASLEAFVRLRWPQAQRMEFCHDGERAVVHKGWGHIAQACKAGIQDQELTLP